PGAQVGHAGERLGGGKAEAAHEQLGGVAAVAVHEADPLVGREAPAVHTLRLGDRAAHRAENAIAGRVVVDVELDARGHRAAADGTVVLVEELEAPVGSALDELEVTVRRRAHRLDAPLGQVVPAVVAVIARAEEPAMRAVEPEVRPLAPPNLSLQADRPRDPANPILAAPPARAGRRGRSLPLRVDVPL